MRKRQSKRRKTSKEHSSKRQKPPNIILWNDDRIERLEKERLEVLVTKFNPEKAMDLTHQIRKLRTEIEAEKWARNHSKEEINERIAFVRGEIALLEKNEQEHFVRKMIAIKLAIISGLQRNRNIFLS